MGSSPARVVTFGFLLILILHSVVGQSPTRVVDIWHSAKHAWPQTQRLAGHPRLSCQNNTFRLCSAWIWPRSLDALILLVALLETEPAGGAEA